MKAKKSLGQNFLHSKGALKKIADAGNISPGELILEIGPGKGALTEFLLSAGGNVVTIEKDDSLVPHLEEKFKKEIAAKTLTIVHADFLETDISNLIGGKPYKIIANIPYYITGEILRNVLSGNPKPTLAVFLVQKEVAERIVTKDGKESILSISVKIYGKPKYLGAVSKTSFNPAPNVDSAVLLIENISEENFKKENISEENFFKVLKTGFRMKRKTLENNLKELISKEKIEAVGISPKARAETLQVSDWIKLAKLL